MNASVRSVSTLVVAVALGLAMACGGGGSSRWVEGAQFPLDAQGSKIADQLEQGQPKYGRQDRCSYWQRKLSNGRASSPDPAVMAWVEAKTNQACATESASPAPEAKAGTQGDCSDRCLPFMTNAAHYRRCLLDCKGLPRETPSRGPECSQSCANTYRTCVSSCERSMTSGCTEKVTSCKQAMSTCNEDCQRTATTAPTVAVDPARKKCDEQCISECEFFMHRIGSPDVPDCRARKDHLRISTCTDQCIAGAAPAQFFRLPPGLAGGEASPAVAGSPTQGQQDGQKGDGCLSKCQSELSSCMTKDSQDYDACVRPCRDNVCQSRCVEDAKKRQHLCHERHDEAPCRSKCN